MDADNCRHLRRPFENEKEHMEKSIVASLPRRNL